MQPISAAFRSAVKTGYSVASRAVILENGSPVTGQLPLEAATVTSDRTSAQRNRISLTLGMIDPTLVPVDLSSITAPGGNEVQLLSGRIDPATGATELVSLGIFPITTATITDTTADLTVTITGYDRAWSVAERKFKVPYVVAAGEDLASAIVALVQSVFPSVVANIVPTAPDGIVTPANNFKEGDDPWAAALTLAASGGYVLFFDSNGILVGAPTPDPTSSSPVWTFADDGTGDSAAITVAHKLTREGVSNDFTVSGSGSNVQPPLQANSSDLDPASETYVAGKFGDIPTFITSSIVTSPTAAQNAADNARRQSLGSIDTITLTAVPMPFLEVDDVVIVKRPRLGVDGKYVIDAVSTPIRHDAVSTLTLRKVI